MDLVLVEAAPSIECEVETTWKVLAIVYEESIPVKLLMTLLENGLRFRCDKGLSPLSS